MQGDQHPDQPVPVLRLTGRAAGRHRRCERKRDWLPLHRQTGDEQQRQGPEQDRRPGRCAEGVGLRDVGRACRPGPHHRGRFHRLRLRNHPAHRARTRCRRSDRDPLLRPDRPCAGERRLCAVVDGDGFFEDFLELAAVVAPDDLVDAQVLGAVFRGKLGEAFPVVEADHLLGAVADVAHFQEVGPAHQRGAAVHAQLDDVARQLDGAAKQFVVRHEALQKHPAGVDLEIAADLALGDTMALEVFFELALDVVVGLEVGAAVVGALVLVAHGFQFIHGSLLGRVCCCGVVRTSAPPGGWPGRSTGGWWRCCCRTSGCRCCSARGRRCWRGNSAPGWARRSARRRAASRCGVPHSVPSAGLHASGCPTTHLPRGAAGRSGVSLRARSPPRILP